MVVSGLTYSQIDTTSYNGGKEIFIGLDDKNYQVVREKVIRMAEERGGLRSYEELELSGDFDSIPDFIFLFDNIGDIEINSTREISIDTNFNKLSQLKGIRITSNVKSISEGIVLDHLEGLDINYINKKFPSVVYKWHNLLEISLQGGSFDTIPKGISALTKLKRLNLSANKIAKLTEEIGKLSALEVLSVCNNDLCTLPASICNLKALRELYVSYNRKINIPAEQMNCIKGLPRFEKLYSADF